MPESVPPLRQAIRFVRRQGWLIVLVPLLAIAIAAVIVHSQHRVYRASMAIVVAQAGGPYLSPLGNQPLSQTMTSILESNVVAQSVVQKLHLPVSPSHVLKNLSVQLRPNSSVLDVSFDSSSKKNALRVLSAVALAFETVARDRLGVSTNLKRPGPLAIVANVYDPPHVAAQPVSPRPARTLGFAGVLGLALGLILAFGRESLDDRVRDSHDAEEWFGAPLATALPSDRRAPWKRGTVVGPRVHTDEPLELLGASLQLRRDGKATALLVTSTGQDEATAAVVASLGMSLARAGESVICVDVNPDAGNLERLLADGKGEFAHADHGLVDVLEQRMDVDQAIRQLDVGPQSANGNRAGQLALLPVGSLPAGVAPPLSPKRIAELVEMLSNKANYVLFDSAPLLSSASAVTLASVVDHVLVVARKGRTRRELAEAIRAKLDEVGARDVGVVLIGAGS